MCHTLFFFSMYGFRLFTPNIIPLFFVNYFDWDSTLKYDSEFLGLVLIKFGGFPSLSCCFSF